jgi:putative tryptophan/tyrosine transport system substrate-binding protein
MRRRTVLGACMGAIIWPLVAAGQHLPRVQRIGVLMSVAEDVEGQARLGAFRAKLEELGWAEGRNARIDVCWCAAEVSRAEACAAQLLAMAPDVILSSGPEPLMVLRRKTQTVPIVFVQVGEPVESGVVSSQSRPERNITGSAAFEYSIGGKWIELLKQLVPHAARVGVLRNAASFAQPGYLRAIEAAAPDLGMRIVVRDVSNASEIEASVDILATESDGLIVLPSSLVSVHRELIVARANRHKLPAIYSYRVYAAVGGLASYGSSPLEDNRQAAVQVDRILRGTSPANLPVQMAPKYELVINLKTAKSLDLKVPAALLARADEAIE